MVTLVGAAVQPVDAATQRLLDALERPELLRQVLDDDSHMVVELLDGRVVVFMPAPDEELDPINGDGAKPENVVVVHREVEDDEVVLRVVARDAQLVRRDAQLGLQDQPNRHGARTTRSSVARHGERDGEATKHGDRMLERRRGDDHLAAVSRAGEGSVGRSMAGAGGAGGIWADGNVGKRIRSLTRTLAGAGPSRFFVGPPKDEVRGFCGHSLQ